MQENEVIGFPSPPLKKKITSWKVMDDSSNYVTYNNILCRRFRKHPCFWETEFSIIFFDAERIRTRVGHRKRKKEREGGNKEGRKKRGREGWKEGGRKGRREGGRKKLDVCVCVCVCVYGVCVCVCAQSCLTLCDPKDCSWPDSSVHGIFQARILEWVAISYSRGSSKPRDRTHISFVSCSGRWVL